MSVIVLGAELPKGYEDCWYLQCDLWKDCYRNGMRDDCPLRPLPEKHGRLRDVDAILNEVGVGTMIAGWGKMYHETVLQYSETIVEAEGS